ncbi:MAG: hypothetical protein K9H15_16355, partial [Bacteroidales bacterium]|nr:hypothetical protein [Bacteroidales bacterium]
MLKHIFILSLSFLLFNAHAQDLQQPADMTAEQLNASTGPVAEQMKAPITDQLRAPTGLTVEQLRAPEQAVITDPFLEFGWIFPAEGKVQGSYRILVASAPFLLEEGVADLWDSGIVPGNRSVNISHGGSPLGPQSTCWWQVKVWSEDGRESAWSAPQQFNIAGYGSEMEENHWVELGSGNWVSKNVQRADFHTIEPELLVRDADGHIFADFGKSAFGILEFTATAHFDDVPLVIHFGERRGEDPTVHKHRGISNITYEAVEVVLKEGMHHYRVEFPERPPSNYLHSQDLAPHYP